MGGGVDGRLLVAQDYPLEELSPRAFEQLTVAVASKVLGSGVEAFGSGPDGGREATFRGRVDWSKTDPADEGAWNGYVVIQAKQSEHPSHKPGQNLSWLIKQVDAELESWMKDSSRRGEFPRYLIFVTNVRLSSVPGSGIDAIAAHIKSRLHEPWNGVKSNTLFARGLREGRVWHRDQLNAWLTVNDSIRLAFKGLLTVGDVLSRLGQLGGLLDPEQFAPVLTAHATNTLTTERWVSFREAGGTTRESVENIFIDLRVDNPMRETRSATDQPLSVLKEVLQRSDMVLKPSVVKDGFRRHVVLTGQAGSGKSTVTKFLTQAIRSRFAADEPLTATDREVIDGTDAALARMGVAPPRGRRWPMRVNLADFADAVGPDGGISLLRWISDRITDRAGLDIKPATLQNWLRYWPCVVILDGLDEVTAPEVRPRVLDEITQFVEKAELEDADLLVVVTTRPTGYTERLMPTHFQQLDLAYLDGEEAIDYGRLVTNRRLFDDLDRRDQLIATFEKQTKLPAMLRLMKTPLQVLIMTILLERAGVLPADRFQLFSRYFDTIYERESAKNTTLAPLLSQEQKVIVDLHEAAGLELQIQSESSNDARAVLPMAGLRALLEDRLTVLGHPAGPKRDRIADRVMQATTERLVLLVPAEDDSVAFEIRSLQELMAGRALQKAPDDVLRERLTLAAPSPHWRNTWVFVAGGVFAEGADHQRDMVVDIVESVDHTSPWPGWLSPVGPELAAALLDDGLATQTPKWQRRLTDVALRAITGPFPAEVHTVAAGLAAAAGADDALRMHVRNALMLGLAGAPRAAVAARLLLALAQLDMFVPGASMRLPEASGTPVGPVEIGPALRARLPEMPDPTAAATALEPVLTEVDDVRVADYGGGEVGIANPTRLVPWDGAFVETINDPVTGGLLELLVGALEPEQWHIGHALGIVYRVAAARKPIGDLLR
ncbi:hypothetical protein JNB62_05030 [Microbacterium jejuense]|uniref:NACHT domain-containing protein n=1 Tax=Microbacterium jejuense TaxID=1263637 RepID=A0ABS7HMB0_9MICO|nr:hypothetical protein [Microbacterium jejuense]MBW9093038.1 hypothetical protein [Microbacterium jejuense]